MQEELESLDRQNIMALQQMLRNHGALWQCLEVLRSLHPDAYISAGALRNLVWSNLHAQALVLEQSEIDVIFYDPTDPEDHVAKRLAQQLQTHFPEYLWDVVNQANVHRWYTHADGQPIAAYSSLFEAVSMWPETATAVAVRLCLDEQLEVVAPLGLADLFELKLRWNPRMVSHTVFLQRIQSKAFLQKWSKLRWVQQECED
jgi:hypothetical protein